MEIKNEYYTSHNMNERHTIMKIKNLHITESVSNYLSTVQSIIETLHVSPFAAQNII